MVPCRETGFLHSERASTSSDREDDTGSLEFSSTSTACIVLPNTQPSPIAESPAHEAALLQGDIPAPAIATKSPLSQEVKVDDNDTHQPKKAEAVGSIGYDPPPLIDGTIVGPRTLEAFTGKRGGDGKRKTESARGPEAIPCLITRIPAGWTSPIPATTPLTRSHRPTMRAHQVQSDSQHQVLRLKLKSLRPPTPLAIPSASSSRPVTSPLGQSEERVGLESSEAYLSRTDTWSGAQVFQALQDINTGIFQFTVSATEIYASSLAIVTVLARSGQAMHDMSTCLGPGFARILASRDHSQDPLSVQ
ncbi:hypothetical protein JOM56_007965 [Amanita muscaria]